MNPDRIFTAADHKPEANETVRCFLLDGTTTTGSWLGEIWWGRGEKVEPVSWQRMKPERIDAH
jgi:hypothetical protein